MKIQKYTANDTTPLAEIYQAAVLKLAGDHYTPKQLQVWSAWAYESNFHQSLQKGEVLIAIKNEQIVSFGQLFPNNHIALLYTHPSYAKQGLAKNIYFALENIALKSREKVLSVEASKVSKPFFEIVGFQIMEEEIAIRNQVEFLRYKMQKSLFNGEW
jgi:putative acetyltransferase